MRTSSFGFQKDTDQQVTLVNGVIGQVLLIRELVGTTDLLSLMLFFHNTHRKHLLNLKKLQRGHL